MRLQAHQGNDVRGVRLSVPCVISNKNGAASKPDFFFCSRSNRTFEHECALLLDAERDTADILRSGSRIAAVTWGTIVLKTFH
ncbi:hypothetical protein Bpfe_009799, partial [Biomphalaria pfeifferi]